MIDLLRSIEKLLTREERRRWRKLVPLLFVSGAIETIATGLVFVLIRIAGDPGYALRTEPLATFFRLLPIHGDRAIVITYGALLALFFVVRSFLLLFVANTHARAASETTSALSTRMLDRYLAAPYGTHLRHKSSELAHNVTIGVDHAINNGLMAMVSMVSELLVSLGLAAFLVLAAPVVTLSTGAVLVVMLAVAVRATKRASRRVGRLRYELERGGRKDVDQVLGGLREIKVLRREHVFHDAYTAQQGRLAEMRTAHSTMMSLPRLSIETIFVVSVVLVVSMVALRDEAHRANILPLLGIYAYAGLRMIPSANRVLMHVDTLRRTRPAIERLVADWETFVPEAAPPPGSERPLEFRDAVRLEDVTYGYASAPRPVLHDVTLSIARGASVGIVGPTGAGKSTMVDLILGLIDPSSGRVTVDGVELPAVRAAWQRRIGYVPQVAFLFDDTIRRNVALGIPDDAIDDERVKRAVAMAQLDVFVASLPAGLDTTVGERGLRLSGGQRQRIAIARSLYHEPELLVFDEATAALDNATERDVTAAIEALKGKKTLIIIAHRLTTVRRCDTLIMLHEGRVVATGSYDQLLETSPDFRAMALAAPSIG
jgi:ATP-binding cassette subfamily C protein